MTYLANFFNESELPALDFGNALRSEIPQRTLAGDDLASGVWRQMRDAAIRRRYIAMNPPRSVRWLAFDIDHEGAVCADIDGILPLANVVTLNQHNGKGHAIYRLAHPVARSDVARTAPLRFLAAIETGMVRRLDADRDFAGLLTKNPWHPEFRALWRHGHGYALNELADALHRENMSRSPKVETAGLGRNVTLFDELRAYAYRDVRRYQREATFGDWQRRCSEVAIGLNLQFSDPLPQSEIRSSSKSVAKWTWARFSDEKFSELQTRRGKKGMASRWGDGRASRVAFAVRKAADQGLLSDMVIGQNCLNRENHNAEKCILGGADGV